jgi:hypothetical protein
MVTRWTKDGKYCWGQPTASHTVHLGSDVYFCRGGAAGVPRCPRQNTAALPLSYDLGVLQRNLAALFTPCCSRCCKWPRRCLGWRGTVREIDKAPGMRPSSPLPNPDGQSSTTSAVDTDDKKTVTAPR